MSETWQDRSTAGDFSDLFVTRYYTNDNLRYRLKKWIDWDFGVILIQIRAEQNQFGQDVKALDYGIESNQLAYTNSMYLGRTTIRNSISYNLANARNDTTTYDWRQKFSPLIIAYLGASQKLLPLFKRTKQRFPYLGYNQRSSLF